ncbi:MAG: FAD/NAD(P)-binding protein [Candidatus Zixiibacteriota bacterium]
MATVAADNTAVRVSGTDPMRPEIYTVRRVHRESHDTFTLTLVRRDGGGGMRFAPGQFNMLYVFGVGEVPVSISGDPADGQVLVHTIRDVGAVTAALHRLKRGGTVGVRGPYGSSWPVRDGAGQDLMIVAGGIGLAPLRPAIYHVLSHREEYGHVVILYGARTPEDLLFVHDLEEWRARFDVHAYVTVDRALGTWRGHVGVVTNLIPRTPFEPGNTTALICGPEVMMRFTALELERRGVPLNRIMVSMERNMKCAVGFCGHCQYGPDFICRDGPVFPYGRIRMILMQREI